MVETKHNEDLEAIQVAIEGLSRSIIELQFGMSKIRAGRRTLNDRLDSLEKQKEVSSAKNGQEFPLIGQELLSSGQFSRDTHARLTRINFPKFDGTDVEGWLISVEQIFYVYQTSEIMKIERARIHLTGDARVWYRSYVFSRMTVALTWNIFKKDLLEEFGRSIHDTTSFPLNNIEAVEYFRNLDSKRKILEVPDNTKACPSLNFCTMMYGLNKPLEISLTPCHEVMDLNSGYNTSAYQSTPTIYVVNCSDSEGEIHPNDSSDSTIVHDGQIFTSHTDQDLIPQESVKDSSRNNVDITCSDYQQLPSSYDGSMLPNSNFNCSLTSSFSKNTYLHSSILFSPTNIIQFNPDSVSLDLTLLMIDLKTKAAKDCSSMNFEATNTTMLNFQAICTMVQCTSDLEE